MPGPTRVCPPNNTSIGFYTVYPLTPNNCSILHSPNKGVRCRYPVPKSACSKKTILGTSVHCSLQHYATMPMIPLHWQDTIESAVFPEFTENTKGQTDRQNDEGTRPVPTAGSLANAATRLMAFVWRGEV